MSQVLTPDREQFLARLNAAVDAYCTRTKGLRPQGTKKWIAQQLSCDRTTLYKYLNDTNRIPLVTLQSLIRLTGLEEEEGNTLLFLGGYVVAVPFTEKISHTKDVVPTREVENNIKQTFRVLILSRENEVNPRDITIALTQLGVDILAWSFMGGGRSTWQLSIPPTLPSAALTARLTALPGVLEAEIFR